MKYVFFILGFMFSSVSIADKRAITQVEQLEKTVADIEQNLIQILKEEEKNYQWVHELQETLVSLKQKQIENTVALKNQQQKLSKLLRAFKTLSTSTSLTVFASCKSRQDIVYTAISLSKIIQHLKETALDLRQELAEIETAKEQIAFAEENLAQSLKTIHQKKTTLESQLKVYNQKLKELNQLTAKENETRKDFKPSKESLSKETSRLNGLTEEKLEFIWPLKGTITGPYTNHPNFSVKGKGVIIEVSKTAPVFCPQEGLVTHITESASEGYKITMTHPQGWQTVLVGIDVLQCYQGQKLQKGQIVGIVEGSLLKSPQIYVQLKRYGRIENPILFYTKE